MPLEIWRRGPTWHLRGRVEYQGAPITDYIRESCGTSDEAGAREHAAARTQQEIRRHLLGDAQAFTFADAVTLYPAKPKEAGYLLKVLPHLAQRPVASITPQEILDLGPILMPHASTDTWRRQIAGPVSAVINRAHALGKCPPIRIRGYTAAERLDQDKRRGKQSRAPRQAGSWDYIEAIRPHGSPHLVAAVEFMFETGARVTQAVELMPRDLDLQRGRVWLGAGKGHDPQWVAISPQMVVTIANLPPRRPHDRKRGQLLGARVFGYATRGGLARALRHACAAAGIEYLSPHQAGRHGFYTELRVRRGVDPVTAAQAGRWSNPALPDRIYAHADPAGEADLRALIRTKPAQAAPGKAAKSRK